MEALAADGRQAEALRVFQDYRKQLADEIGTEPSVDVRAIEQWIATDWTSAPMHIPLPVALVQSERVIGRSYELRVLADAVTRARSDGLQTLVLCGEPGIGKTTLLAAFANEVHERGEATVLYRALRRRPGGAVATVSQSDAMVRRSRLDRGARSSRRALRRRAATGRASTRGARRGSRTDQS